ncbi:MULTISPECIES: hypothetical protein [unclassified Moorena]|uniref:hypothetical protein n=1 Tax=unclassified Moorena TaxID=2683338 RepID=UPI0013B87EBE|nr:MULTISPECIES: hypothetical protein [unclassified Moorena]NEQ13235.1 hypothetical protein [Moorena sp. SIO3E2]NEP37485.1 hypothetical protein [Moorena sp. SIO3B2]NEP66262.1 hypothetical protein [Moorena sp. SIO3A5]NEQ09873.1 hypothetical protein [Moorena sp. SIO4E2]NER88026.1 hypothetical protein [Moorena sp. SIO3A2]
MSYRPCLYPWVMIRLSPRRQPVVFARFRNRSDGESYLQALKPLMPNAKFVLFFDIGLPMDQEEST